MEDLTAKGFVDYPKEKEIDENHTVLMMKEIAKLHAASISLRNKLDKDLIDVYPLLLESWMTEDPELINPFIKVFARGMLFNANLANELPEFKYLVKWLKNVAPRSMDVIVKNLCATDPWRVICHGDYHKGNVMFK